MAEIDREKVIRPLQTQLNKAKANGLDVMFCSTEIIEKVIALLKEQEPVNPIRIVNDNNFLYDLCGFCGKTLPVSIDYDRARYCPLCGRPVKWYEWH